MSSNYMLIFTAFVAGCMLIMGVLLGLLRFYHHGEARTFRTARAYTAVACLTLATSYVMDVMYPIDNGHLREIIWYGVAALQALLFTCTCSAFVAPHHRQTKLIVIHIAVTGAVLAAMIAVHLTTSQGEGRHVITMGTCLAVYVLQMSSCTIHFIRTYRRSIAQLEEIYDDEFTHRLAWVLRIFIYALTVGLMAGAVMVLYSEMLDVVFKCCVVVVYAAIVLGFVNYYSRALFVVKANKRLQEEEQKHPSPLPEEALAHAQNSDGSEQNGLSSDASATKIDAQTACENVTVQQRIDRWVEEKNYLKADLSVDEIASEMGITHAEMAQHFAQLGINFRSWRIALRISEAERLLHELPSIATQDLITACGYNDRSNFHKHFHKQTGLSLGEYKKRIERE